MATMMQVGVGSVSLELGDVQLAQVAGNDQSGSGTSPGQQQQQLARSLWGTGFLTLVMSVGTFLHTPQAQGVLLDHHALAYYITLAWIFIAGVVEAGTALWVSQAPDDSGRRAFGRAVLWASIIPLATVVSLGGYTILFNG
ncbi:hypothetical protein ABZP36_014522 [Zizania latifolia]